MSTHATIPGTDGRPLCRWCAAAPEFEAWLYRMGLFDSEGRLAPQASSVARRLIDYKASA